MRRTRTIPGLEYEREKTDLQVSWIQEPRWRPARRHLRNAVLPEVWDWLLDEGSLTQRLRQRCGGRFRVALRRQGWGRPSSSERRVLGMGHGERAVIREVHLMCGDTPWVFARTVIPVSSLRGAQRRLTRLGSKPLGAALFADPSMWRGAVEVACLRPAEPLYARAMCGAASAAAMIWGRRSVFHLQERPLLVTEIFLPALWTRGDEEAKVRPRVQTGV